MSEKTLRNWSSGTLAAALLFGASATAVFAASPSILLSGGGTPYSTVTVSGSGFAPNESVVLLLGLSSGHATTSGMGDFSGATLTVPNVPAGTYVVIAVGQNSGAVAFGFLYVSAFYPTAAPSGWYLAPGSQLTWSGSGFAPHEIITIAHSSTTIASFHADSSGNFIGQGSSTIPYAAHGTNITYTVRGTLSGTSLSYLLSVANLYPYATPSAWYILPGSTVTFSGAGFGPGETISVMHGSSTVAHITTDSTGAFTGQGSVTIPYGTGTVTYTLVGDQSGAVAIAPITRALFYPSITPSVWYATPGSFLTLSGTGFAPNENVALMSNGTTSTTHTDGMGNFSSFSLHLPTTPNTTATITATGQTSGASTQIGVAVGAYYSWFELSTWWAMGGSPLTIHGHSFAAGETTTASSGSQNLGSSTTDINGDVIIHTHVPTGKPGPATISLTGQTSGAHTSATMTLSPVWTDFELAAYAGSPGSAIHFIGHGYQFGEQVDITTNRTGNTPVAIFTTDNTGSFTGSWTIPDGWSQGTLLITATSTSGDTKSITYYVTGS